MNWTVLSSGWPAPPASFRDPARRECTSSLPTGAVFKWDRWDIAELRLAHNAALLVLQGLPLKNLFEHAHLSEKTGITSMQIHNGPFILLKATYSKSDVIPRLTEVVLGRVQADGVGLPEQEVLGALVQAVLTP